MKNDEHHPAVVQEQGMKQNETALEMNRRKILSFPTRNAPKSEVKQKSWDRIKDKGKRKRH